MRTSMTFPSVGVMGKGSDPTSIPGFGGTQDRIGARRVSDSPAGSEGAGDGQPQVQAFLWAGGRGGGRGCWLSPQEQEVPPSSHSPHGGGGHRHALGSLGLDRRGEHLSTAPHRARLGAEVQVLATVPTLREPLTPPRELGGSRASEQFRPRRECERQRGGVFHTTEPRKTSRCTAGAQRTWENPSPLIPGGGLLRSELSRPRIRARWGRCSSNEGERGSRLPSFVCQEDRRRTAWLIRYLDVREAEGLLAGPSLANRRDSMLDD
ncbi:uncharacterized protein LOC130458088 [Monodelphis domestica]|uniref:uncharacterized protein LOC130458088 n=1 Tax=Monodelphis domestica TaxID=13616 RepID=UPI0024E1C148|nr:uncharacterized protein LOC130458088 [Monodelphis domestica]